jgi:sodium-dependent dicarboxylate transporter 2/3/5
VIFWLTEAIPIPVTALLGSVLAVLIGAATPQLLLVSFTDPIMALIIGSFVLTRAMQVHGVDQRLAAACVTHPWVGGRPARLLWAIGLAAWVLAMWIGITACVAMLFPVVLAAGRSTESSAAPAEPARRWTAGLLLMLVSAASAGAMATPIGTPPNLIGVALIDDLLGVSIGFLDWMRIGLPIALALLGSRYLVVWWAYRSAAPKERAVHQPARSDPWTPGQRNSLAAFVTAIVLWVTPGVAVVLLGAHHSAAEALQEGLSPGMAALIAASLLFLLPAGGRRPTLSWRDAVRIDWGVVLLFGGGIALGRMMVDTGLAQHLGQRLFGASAFQHPAALAGLAALAALIMSEVISNTAAANLVVPMVLSAAGASRSNVVLASVTATLAASSGFMLPVSTPANAMIYGSGAVRLPEMVKTGIVVDVLGYILIWAACVWLVPLVLG